MKKPTMKEQLSEQAAISERLQARVHELEDLVETLRENVADEQRMYDALLDKRHELEDDLHGATFRAEELENERDEALDKLSSLEASLLDTWQKRLLKLAACCERALPPESLDESWDVACARRELREAYDTFRNFTEVNWNDKVTKHTRLGEAYAWSGAPALLFPGDA